MIKIIYGGKGTGKTKQLIDVANENAKDAKGLSVFITDNKRCMYDVARNIRFIDVADWNVAGEDALCGFVKGVAACNSDHEYIYIDGVARISGKDIKDLAGTFYMLDKISNENDITVILTCSCDKEELPDFVKKYI
ncbi:MAG: ATP-binding protein [Clostridia bacterium]|nr:ATP-binding protein [Clostridia bacterium]